MKAYNQEFHTKELLQFFAKHPGMMATMAYALLTLCGVIYSNAFYAKFDVPILKLADLPDMLVAGVSEPIAIVMFCGGIALAVISDMMFIRTFRGSQRWREAPESLKKRFFLLLYYTPKRKVEVLGFILIIFFLYAFVFVELYADWKSEQIKAGNGHSILLSSEEHKHAPLFLLGSTTNFVITYDGQAQKAVLTPIEGVKEIIPVLESTEKQPEAEENEAGESESAN